MTDPTPAHGCMIDGQPAMPILISEYNALVADLAALRAVARGYCPACGRGDAAPTVEGWEAERRRADSAEEAARRVLEQRQEMAEERYIWQQRGDRAEDVIARVTAIRDQWQGRLLPSPAYELLTELRAALDEPGPAATQATEPAVSPSRRAGLHDALVAALGRIPVIPPVAHRRAQADNVLALLYREWPWLRAEAEDAAPDAVDALYEQWVKAGPPPLGVPLARWWDKRLAELRNALNNQTSPDRHVYLSTGCLHGDHGYCQAMTGLNGAKRPGSCKHCGARCICGCHAVEEPGPA